MRRREFALLMGPSALVMFGLLVVPLFYTIVWSFQEIKYGQSGTFVGLDNFRHALTDERFVNAVAFTVMLTAVVTGVLLVMGYLVAVWLNTQGRIRPVFLGALLVSYVLPNVVGSVAYSWLFDDNFGGIANHLIGRFTGTEVLWFTAAWPNRFMIATNTIWHMLPFAMLVILAGLQSVPRELREAATIDGASAWRVHWHVIIPVLRGVLGFVCLISIMDVLRTFDNLIPLSPQAPTIGNESIMLYIYNVAFRDGSQQLGLGSAINLLTILVILVCLYPFIRSTLKTARSGS